MTDQDNSYRPRSPDFSSLSGSLPPFHDSYHQNAYILSNPLSTPQASYDASPFFNPHSQLTPQSSYIPQSYQPAFHEMAPQTRSRTQRTQQSQQHPQVLTQSQPNPQDLVPPAQYRDQALQLQQHQQQLQIQHQQQQQQQYLLQKEQQDLYQQQQQQQHLQQPQPPTFIDPNSYPNPTQNDSPEAQRQAPVKSANPSNGIEVKTKFPVARIKRIMQADEDVGKVAQVTPIAVSKSLELFMISLVTKAAQQAKDRSSKRVTASHLKEAIAKDEVLDFLADIISKVPDQAAGRKHDEDGSDQNDGHKKKGGRRKKEDPDDDP